MLFSLNPCRPVAPATLLAAGLLLSLSACQRPVAYFQPTARPAYAPPVAPPPSAANYVPDTLPPPVAWADARLPTPPENAQPVPEQAVAERVMYRLARAQRLLVAPAGQPSVPVVQPGPKPKPGQRKTLRQFLGLPPRKQLNWWQRISWQLKAATVVILVAVVFAILNITILAIIFGIIGAFLLIRGLKKSFKVRRGIFGLGR